LVYLFQAQKRKLNRLALLLGFLSPQTEKAVNFRLFISQLILDAAHHKSFRSFASENLSLLTERIVQSSSRIGEHYVTYTWADFKNMFKSASGGGALTSITVFIKFGISHLGLEGFLKGLLESLNYSGSFVCIQIMGWTLATKQPSSTAPFIAAELRKSTTEARRSIVALLRTQFIAVIGNLALVFPLPLAISWIALLLGHPVLDPAYAHKVLNSSNITGPTVLFATLTGALLFVGSLAGGWVENWMTLTQISKRIRFNKVLMNCIGSQRAERLADFIQHNSNALAANIILGFLLGMTPAIAKFLNLGLEVRHVTLATGSFATALPILMETGLDTWPVINAVAGIFAIAFLNITVSFLLAFLLASISSKVRFSSFLKLFVSGLRLVLVRPWLLLVPEGSHRRFDSEIEAGHQKKGDEVQSSIE
jgi:site-specific recombinase